MSRVSSVAARVVACVAGLAVALVALLTLGIAGPAAAAGDSDVLLSGNGTDFSPVLPGSLFDELGRLIPGESLSVALWVRNPTSQTVAMRVSTREMSIPSAAYADGVSLTVWNSAAGVTTAASLARVAQCDVLVPSHPIAPDSTERIVFTFTMSDLDGSVGQSEAARVSVAVAMRDAVAGAFPDSACDDDASVISWTGTRTMPSADRIAYTGSEPPVAIIIAAAASTGAGIFLIAGTRRRRDAERAAIETRGPPPVP